MRRRPATPQEARAVAHPLRLRILRLCLDEALTNRELADRLDRDPGTVHHHVRVLADLDFLHARPVRKGASGALEKPYRATGKSWEISTSPFEHSTEDDAGAFASLEAFRDELYEAGPDALREAVRLGLRLNDSTAEELRQRLLALLEEFAARRDPDGRPYGAYFALHLMASDRHAR